MLALHTPCNYFLAPSFHRLSGISQTKLILLHLVDFCPFPNFILTFSSRATLLSYAYDPLKLDLMTRSSKGGYKFTQAASHGTFDPSFLPSIPLAIFDLKAESFYAERESSFAVKRN